MRDRVVMAVNMLLLSAAILLVISWIIPAPKDCFIPPHAPTRGIYDQCWTFWELWA